MSNRDLLSAALDECGLDLETSVQVAPQAIGQIVTSPLQVDQLNKNPLAFSNTTANPAIKANNFIVYNRATNSFYFKDGKPVTIVSNTFLPKPGVATTVRPNNTTSTPTIVKPKIITSQELSKLISNGQSLLNKDNAPKKIGQAAIQIRTLNPTVFAPQQQQKPQPQQAQQSHLASLASMVSSTNAKTINNSNNDAVHDQAALPTKSSTQPKPRVPDIPEDDDGEEEIFQAETYSDYMPSKLKVGNHHPDPVVETSSLSSVHPPDVWYRLAIPEEIIDEGRLSALQLEAIVYACQQHETYLPDGSRSGFLIGDGAGVGKGRTVAGIIYENYILGRKKALWLSVSNDLKYDAERDLRDIGAKKIQVFPLNKFKYGKITSKENGGFKKGVIFSTYSSLISESHTSNQKYRTRLKQILHWCGEDFEGVIIFDECHKAKNLCPSSGTSKATKTGQIVLELQKKLPKARIVYASATGATEPRDMAYMTRLGLWGPGTSFPEFSDFISTVEKRGVGAMELVAIDMKLRGMYIARQLSFSGVNFRIEEIPLSKKFIRLYNECVSLWVDARAKFEKALELMEGENSIKKAVWAQFWASHQRFFKYLCIASKVKYAVNLSREALKDEKSVVIGLQSTGEAKTLEQLDDNGGELTDFVSTAKAVFQSLIEKHFPAPNRRKTMKLLGLDTSFLDDLGIKIENKNGHEVLVSKPLPVAPLQDPELPATNIKVKEENKATNSVRPSKRNAAKKVSSTSTEKWTDDSSDDDDAAANSNESDFKPSDSEDDEDDEMEGVMSDELTTDSEEFSDIEPWDLYQQNMLKKEGKIKKRKRVTKSGPRKRGPKLTITKYDHVKAEFMSEQAGEICEKMRDEILLNLEAIGTKLPPNTLDELIEELGGSSAVAEMTGRKGRVISSENGSIQYESRTENDVPLEILNLTEKQRFMDGEKMVAIISEAASSGISLHSDRRAKNRKRRVHITIELPWSADRAIQQFGRTHRSNQVNAPEYVFLISDLAGEQRFASIVAKRLESLGALTHGDRRATESRDLSKYNIDNKYGRQALEIVMRSIVNNTNPIVPPPESYHSNFFNDCRQGLMGVGMVVYDKMTNTFCLDKDYQVMSKFLNRILGLDVDVQNALFQYFTDTLDAVVKQAKRLGRYDLGIMDLTSEIGKVERVEHRSFLRKHSTGAAKIEFHVVKVERGMSWAEASSLWGHCKTPEEGFYVMNGENTIRKSIFLAVADTSTKVFAKQVFRIYKPNIGLQSKTETLASLKERGHKIPFEETESLWSEIHEKSEKICGHALWYGSCRKVNAKLPCDVGLRQRVYHILSGSVLTIWSTIEKAVPHVQSRLQIVRLKTQNGLRVIGTLIPSAYVDSLLNMLSPTE